MSRIRKILLSVLGIVLLGLVLAAGGVYHTLRSSLPDHSAAFTGERNGAVSVTRDNRGVARIRAKDSADLFFSQGYVHADERLWQMEFNRRVVRGRLAEILGADLAGTDRFLRTVGLHRIARRVVEKTTPEGRAVMAQYASGVNARLKEGRLPPELRILGIDPDPWNPEDIAGVIALMAFDLGGNWQAESLRMALEDALEPGLFKEITPPYGDRETPVIWQKDRAVPEEGRTGPVPDIFSNTLSAKIEPFLPRFGSNSWVVAPDRWTGKHALVANDPHLSLGLPAIWFENSLEVEGGMRVYGWSIPGAPGVVIGHNEHIAWGSTNIGDTQDLFVERRHPDDPHRFFFDGDWYEADVMNEEIRIKGKDEPERIEVVITKNGPVMGEDPPVSLKWTAWHVETSTLDAVIGMNRAKDAGEFREALSLFSLPVQNIVYADTKGNIGFKTAGLLPLRKKGKGVMPQPGWDPAYGWEGFIPDDELPSLYNPPGGFIITANHRVAGDDYPYTIAIDDAPPYRMMRIVDVLSAADALTLSDMKDLQNDWYNMHAARRLPLFIERVRDHAARFPEKYDGAAATGLSIMADWAENPVSLPEQAAPAIYAAWYLNFMEDVFREKMGDTLYHRFIDKGYLAYKALDHLLEKGESAWFENGGAGKTNDVGDMPAKAYLRAMETLSARLGPNPETWQWQDLQSVALSHVLGENRILARFFNRGPHPWGGDHETVGRAAYNLKEPFEVTFAAGLRYIAVMDPEGIDARAVIAGGQSGHFLSDHYDDQLETWLDGRYYRVGFAAEPDK